MTAGHVCVFLCIYKDRSLRTPFNCYVVALSVADCLISIIAAPIHSIQQLSTNGLAPEICTVKITVATSSIAYSLLSMGVIAVTRLLAVLKPLKYRSMTIKTVIFVIGAQATVCIVVTALMQGSPNVTWSCRLMHMMHTKEAYEKAFVVFARERGKAVSEYWWISIPCIALVSFLVTTVSYVRMFFALRSRPTNIVVPQNQSEAGLQIENEAGPQIENEAPETQATVTTQGAYKADILTLQTAFILTLAFFVCYIPSFVIGFLVGSGSGYLYPIVTSLTYFHCVLNPFVYLWKSQQFRKSIKKLLTCF
ncbi:alpha-1D adrenergic receptor-like [Lingula anatina]|uniref:Alpha-1D adrenergic receptor-like n=1 Tax=Lingula anatina TaxID=7574 RepID=A0A1S3J8K8_LINAN|nr:alpha-1D adrenergic receptor-like [Lingula anatina]|eukprot:XP_013406561.1 alpha-1D adrenergic receptor-like [Lingula anatina]